MDWYYAIEKERKGPFSEDEFKTLVESNEVTNETLVWNSTMADWDKYGNLSKPGDLPVRSQETDDTRKKCVECYMSYPQTDMVRFENSWVCRDCKNIFVQKIKEGIQTDEYRYAGFWIRFGAKLIDGIIITVVFLLIVVALGAIASFTDRNDEAAYRLIGSLFYLFYYGITIFYYVFFVGKYSATPGKMACGIKIITPETDRVSYGKAFGRYLSEILSQLIIYIGYIMVAWDKEKKGLHDIICNTRVVYK
ncbi:MAG: RDD family protein [Desulfobacterales bacterium]|nr:RDD family protein [Desulfobacterales bacterium]MCP4160775.1 RDD family protein [Deltaproteobacteria bacterium]